MPPSSLLLGIDIGGTKSAVSLGNSSGQILLRDQWPSLTSRGPTLMIQDIFQHTAALLAQHALSDPSLPSRAGVSIGGPLDCERGIIHNPPGLPGWDAIPLQATLEAQLNLPVRVLHDAAACALAEHLWGDAQKSRRLAYLTCGTGLGVGLIFDGIPYTGTQGRFPEIGHARLHDHGPIGFGKAGSIEAFGSGSGLPNIAAWLFPHRWAQSPPDGELLSQLAAAGDLDALTVLDRSADSVGRVCALLGDLLILDRIVIGSLGRYLGPSWMTKVRARFHAEVLPFVAQNCPIEIAALADRLQDCSSLAAAMHSS